MSQVTSAICQRCAACCSLVINGELIACKHLTQADGTFRCSIYATRPQVCRDYDCTRDDGLAGNALVQGRAMSAMRIVS